MFAGYELAIFSVIALVIVIAIRLIAAAHGPPNKDQR